MATITVSTTSALISALRSSTDGDIINLTTGHYRLDVSNLSKAVTITSNGSAVIDHMDLSRVSNLTIQGIDFNGPDNARPMRIWGSDNIKIRNGDVEGVASGHGTEMGLLIQSSSDIRISKMTMHGFDTAIWYGKSENVKLIDNTLTNISHDGIVGGQVDGLVIKGNSISLNTPVGLKHSDGIQMWNTTGVPGSSDILIEDNIIRTHNAQSHGIYMGNASANNGRGPGSYFQNVVIQDNTIVSGDGLGLSWGHTNHLDIRGNIVLDDPNLPSHRGVPSIRVHAGATDVSVTGNVTHKAPLAADKGWQTKPTPGAWDISDNSHIAVGSTLAEAQAMLASMRGGSSAPAAALAAFAADADSLRQADTFSFDAHGKTDVVRGLDFGGGDRIVLHDYAAGTFGGLAASADGTTAIVASVEGLRALEDVSTAVDVHRGRGDTLVIDIDQPGHDHTIRLVGMEHEYF